MSSTITWQLLLRPSKSSPRESAISLFPIQSVKRRAFVGMPDVSSARGHVTGV